MQAVGEWPGERLQEIWQVYRKEPGCEKGLGSVHILYIELGKRWPEVNREVNKVK